MTPEETAAALEKAEADRDEALAKLAKAEEDLKAAKKSDPEPASTEINKDELDPAVRARLEKAEADAAAFATRLQKAEELAKAERDERITREFVEMAKSEFVHLGSADELGPRLKRMSETLSKDDFDAHLESLRAANAQIDTSNLFAEIGKSGDPSPTGGGTSELATLQKAADELRKNDNSLTAYEAMHLAMRNDREAQMRYLQGIR